MLERVPLSFSTLGLIIALCALVFLLARNRRPAREPLSDAQLAVLFDALSESIVVVDRQLNIVHINKAAGELLGLPARPMPHEEVAGTFEVCTLDGRVLPVASWPIGRALRGEFLQSEELLVRRKDQNRTLATEITTAPLRDRAGVMTHILVTHRDVTQARAMQESRLRLAAIVESSEDAIIGKDAHGTVTSWNAAAEHTFGYTAEEMVGQSIRKLIPEDRMREEDEILRRIRLGERVQNFETVRRTKAGKAIRMSVTVSPIHDSFGRVVGASKIARNITERKQMERQLAQSRKMEAIGQLTGGIAHDFNNLLGIVIGNLDLLEREEANNAAAMKRIRTALRASLRGADLTKRLLAFSSSEELKPAVLDLGRAVHSVIELASRVVGPDIRFVTNLPETPQFAYVDRAILESALLNLLVNARDAMPTGGTLTIAMQTSFLDLSFPPLEMGQLKSGYYVCLSASDTGTGMSREIMDRAFEPFFTTKPRGRGTGLGLAMVYGFCKQSGGAAHIYSEPGLGTTVSMYLPVAPEASPPLPNRIAPPVIRAPHARTVLLVDDEVDLLEIATQYLEEMGCIPLIAQDGASAVAMLREHDDIDLLMTDVVMGGGLSGTDVVEAAREIRPGIAVIYCSGFPSDALAERNALRLSDPLLRKPYLRSEFIDAVKQALPQ